MLYMFLLICVFYYNYCFWPLSWLLVAGCVLGCALADSGRDFLRLGRRKTFTASLIRDGLGCFQSFRSCAGVVPELCRRSFAHFHTSTLPRFQIEAAGLGRSAVVPDFGKLFAAFHRSRRAG